MCTAKCLPIRPVKQIYSRASRLLGDFKRGKWSAEELEELTRYARILLLFLLSNDVWFAGFSSSFGLIVGEHVFNALETFSK